MASYPNSFPGWEQDVLAAINAPLTAANVAFLDSWHAFEGSNATNNPLNTTAYTPVPATVGTGAINSAGVQNYATPAAGAAATAAFLQMPNFTSILTALKTGSPSTYLKLNLNDVTAELRKWGSGTFADSLGSDPGAYRNPVTHVVTAVSGAVGQAASTAATDTANALAGPLGKVASGFETWLQSTATVALLYVVLTAGAFVLVYKGLDRAAGGGISGTVRNARAAGAKSAGAAGVFA